MVNYAMQAARLHAYRLASHCLVILDDGESWTIDSRQTLVLPPGDARRQRLCLEGLPASALWWDADGIRNSLAYWHWQPEQAGQTAPWLATIHHSWPYHPPRWLLNAELVVLETSAFAEHKRLRHYQQRSLLRFWRQRRAPLIYLAQDGDDAWHVQQLAHAPA